MMQSNSSDTVGAPDSDVVPTPDGSLNAEAGLHHFTTDDELGQALEDMFTQEPSAIKLGLSKLRTALYERFQIRVSEKRLREFKAQMRKELPNPDLGSHNHHNHDHPSAPDEAPLTHDIYAYYPEEDAPMSAIQRIWRDSPEGRKLPLPQLKQELERQFERIFQMESIQRLREVMIQMHEDAIRRGLTHDTNMDDYWVDIFRKSDGRDWAELITMKKMLSAYHDMIDQGTGHEVRVMPLIRLYIDTGRRFKKDADTNEWTLIMPPISRHV